MVSIEAREADVDDSLSPAGSHPMEVIRREDPAKGGLVRDVQKAKVAGALFRQKTEMETKPKLRRFGRYIVLDVLGQGGMGVVLKGYDEDLNRQVALKVLHSDRTEREGQRLKREAQALAKLAHPNVVQVFEVGEAEGQVFVAMELVKGQTLRQWQSEQDTLRGWKECVEVYLQAGQGLAAAHAAGLVHRDFKPSNVVIDDEQRVRVLDFGLVRQVDSGELDESRENDPEVAPRPKDDVLGASLTGAGKVMGTLPYMPPEQIEGKPADARSDQFSFCVSLFEAVYGERPFKGKTVAALAMSIGEGVVGTVPRGTKVPAKLREVLLRGLSTEPEQRWEAMEVLLADLRRLVAPRSRRWLALGLTGGLAALGGTLALGQYIEVMDRCTGAATELDGIWDEGGRQEVKAAILGTELVYAPGTWDRVEARLDDYAEAWMDKHIEVCEATQVRREQTEDEMSLRMTCLRKRRTDLNATVKVLVQADAAVVGNAVELVAGLPSLSPRCDDLDRLLEQRQRVPPPEDPEVAEEVKALREQLADIKAEAEATGKYAEALEQVKPVVKRAEVLGYMPLLAEAMGRQGWLRDEYGQYAEAEQNLASAYALAVEHGHDEVVFEVAALLGYVVGSRQARYPEALVWGRTALHLAKRSGETTHLASVKSSLGNVLASEGKYEEAERHFRRALRIREDALGADHPYIAISASNLGNVLSSLGKYEEAEHQHRRALQIHERSLGADHPDTAMSVGNLGVLFLSQRRYEEAERQFRRVLKTKECVLGVNHPLVANSKNALGIVLARQGRYKEAERHFRQALQIKEGALGADHPDVASSMNNLGIALDSQGKYEEAERHYRRALQIQEGVLSVDHPDVAANLNNLGVVFSRQGKYKQAEDQHRRALQIREGALGADHPDVASSMNNLGDVLYSQGRYEEAERLVWRAILIYEHALGADHPDVAYSLVRLAEIDLVQSEFKTARENAKRAASILSAGKMAPDDLAEARFVLARALWSDRHERPRARGLAEQARDAFAEYGKGREEDLAEVEQWLRKHRYP